MHRTPGMELASAARVVAGLIGAVLVAAGSGSAGAASVGARFGWSNVDDEVFTGSGDLGGTNLIGLHLGLGLTPLLDLEVAGEYTSQEFSFTEGLVEGYEAAGEGEWEDMALYATARANLLNFAVLPIKGYVGGGVNIHWAELQVRSATQVGTGDPNAFEEAIEDLAGDRSEPGWHLVGGLRLAPLGAPLSGFVEARYQRGFDEEQLPATQAIYGGLSIEL